MPNAPADELAALGATVRQLREARGLSQEDLAERSTLSRNTVSNIERGAFAPSFLAVAGIATAFEMPLSELIRAYEDRLRRQAGTASAGRSLR